MLENNQQPSREKPGRVQSEQAGTQHGHLGRILAWGLWDWGSAAINSVVTTFVFTVYLTSESFGDKDALAAQLGFALSIAGIIIALLAPITGVRSDSSRRYKTWLAVNTYVVVALTALLFFVYPDPHFLFLGLALLAAGNVFFEFASVNYNAMLAHVSTPKSVGRVSGLGWGLGYVGGVVLLTIIYLGFLRPEVGWFGVTDADGSNVRSATLFAAIWFGVFALPVFLAVPEKRYKRRDKRKSPSLAQSYTFLFQDIAHLWRTQRNILHFLIASAIFRDGLVGVFAFGGVIAGTVFGLSATEIILFAIFANIVAGISTILAGMLDDFIGAKPIIVASLIGLITTGVVLFLLHDHGQAAFWIPGLVLGALVGPAQSASRSFLLRITPPGHEGEVFGLYATTGRAVSFLAPALYALFVTIFGEAEYGILALALILLAGLILLIPVRSTVHN